MRIGRVGINTQEKKIMSENIKHQVVIVGGGTAGICVAARLHNFDSKLDIAIIEPSTKHYYQPLWTLVGGGVFPKEESERDEVNFIPKGAEWIQERATEIRADENKVVLESSRKVSYEFLVVCPGLQLDWGEIKGLKDSLGKDGVCSNYSYDTVESTWQNIKSLKSGNAIFTEPITPVKCGGAPQKICYLAEDYFRKNGVRENINVRFISGKGKIFAVPLYADSLTKHIKNTGIEAVFNYNLVEVKHESKEAIFQSTIGEKELVQKYDMLHVTPPMSAPDFIKQSTIAAETGWVEVDKSTLQHIRYSNIFRLGDASNLPTSKTGAAIRKQAPVAAHNLYQVIRGQKPDKIYDGYTSCPLVTGYDSLILAEFDYNNEPQETFPFDQSKERYSMYLLKKYILPKFYWYGMLKGRA